MPKSRQRQLQAGIDRELGSQSLCEFIQRAWPVLEPSTPFVTGWHLDAISDHLEAVTKGQIRNLLINVPPRHMKSLAVSVFWPVWSWVNNPALRWLFSSYALSLSIRDSLKCRRLIESPWFQARWSDRFTLLGDQNAKMRFDNNHMGYRIATSVDGYATGEGGDMVVVDDPHSVAEKESDAVRETTLTWWDETMSTRLNDQKTGAKIIVMQRIHEKDLSGHVLAQGGYVHLNLPAEYDPDRRCCTVDLGKGKPGEEGKLWEDPRTERHELLWPKRIGPKEIAELKLRLGPTGYAGQFQQIPSPAGGGRFKEAYFRHWRDAGNFYQLIGGGSERAVNKADCWRFAAMDPAGIDKDQNDKACYTVIQVWDVTPTGDMILVDQCREQMETPQAADKAVDLCRRYSTDFIAVEKNGLGLGIVQTISLKGIAVIGINARGSKEARSETAEIRLAAGKVYFPQDALLRAELEKELVLFPNSEFMDQVDALSHACALVQERHGAPMNEADTEAFAQQASHEVVPAGRYSRAF